MARTAEPLSLSGKRRTSRDRHVPALEQHVDDLAFPWGKFVQHLDLSRYICSDATFVARCQLPVLE